MYYADISDYSTEQLISELRSRDYDAIDCQSIQESVSTLYQYVRCGEMSILGKGSADLIDIMRSISNKVL